MIIDSLPWSTMTGPLLLSVLSVTALVISDLRQWHLGRYLFKPLAAAAFIWLALLLDATHSEYGRIMLLALVFCMAGDLLLMPDTPPTFLAGLVAFLCGHLLFAIAFYQLGDHTIGMIISILPALLLAGITLRWLQPHLPENMRFPVALYVLVITVMLLCAGHTVGTTAAPLIIIGAWAFAASDLAVARRNFVDPSRVNALWGTPLYFAAQMILASSIALL